MSQYYWIDMWAKVERMRMHFVANNQTQLKAESYQGLIDAASNDDLHQAGKVVILPSSIMGSPRWYVEQTQDALAIVRAMGKPTAFLTLTANPKWPEITSSLEPGESPFDRPDIVARVFRAKLRGMMDRLTKGKLLGEVTYFVYTIEWQKRKGLPHAHCLFKLKEEPRTAAEVDKLICAEIPGEDEPELRKAVESYMCHGPCGKLNPKCPCMKQVLHHFSRHTLLLPSKVGDSKREECGKGAPWAYASETFVDDNSFPVYRRRSPEEGGHSFVNDRGLVVTNQWIVTYNRDILQLWDGHANLKIVTSVISVKYIFKYEFKGE